MSQIFVNAFMERANVNSILWDHAGVLVNNEPLYGLARSNMFTKFGYPDMTPEVGKSYLGFGEKRLFEHFREAGKYPAVIAHYGSPQNFAEAFNAEYKEVRASVTDYKTLIRPGLDHFLHYAIVHGIPMAIVSNSNDEDVRLDAEKVVSGVNARYRLSLSVNDVFPIIMTANTMTEEGIPHKPEPDCYIEGFGRLERKFRLAGGIQKAVVVDDSWTGQQAAVGSGAMMFQVYYSQASEPRACRVHPEAYLAIPDECGDFRQPYLNLDNPKVHELFPEYVERGRGASAPARYGFAAGMS